MHDQADELRHLVRQCVSDEHADGPAPRLVLVAGGKGGVGTTTIAVNLAVALALQGRRIALVNANLDRAGVAALCQTPDRGSIVDVLAGRRGLHEVLERGPAGVQVLPGAWGSPTLVEPSAMAQQRLIADLASMGPHAELVIVDVGSTRNQFVQSFWLSADVVLAVTTTDAIAVMDAYAAIKTLLGPDAAAPVLTVVNLAPDAATASDVHARIDRACRRFLSRSTAVGGTVPMDAPVHDAARMGRPFLLHSPRCDAARAVERLADTLWTQVSRGAPLLGPSPRTTRLQGAAV